MTKAALIDLVMVMIQMTASWRCCEPYHCTLDVCMMNEVHKYWLYVQDGWSACILPLRHNNDYLVKYQNIVLEIHQTDLSMKDVS